MGYTCGILTGSFFDYAAYLASDRWQTMRAGVLGRDEERCTRCGGTTYLDVHHLTYERIGSERLADLVTLCASCHIDTHGIPSEVEPQKLGFLAFRRSQRAHQRIFIAAWGPYPHGCCFCDGVVAGYTEPMDRTAALVHHLDDDHKNNDPNNLAAAHWGCHSSYHMATRECSPEQRAKQSAAMTGRTQSPETRAKKSAKMRGYKWPPDFGAKISAAKKGRPGRPLSAEARAKVSAAQKGRLKSAEHLAKIAVANTGKRATPETRAKLRASHLGKTPTAETRAKMSAARKGKPLPPRPRISCVKCHREMAIGRGMLMHLRACVEGKGEPLPHQALAALDDARGYMHRRVSCIACHREISVLAIARHLRVCPGAPPNRRSKQARCSCVECRKEVAVGNGLLAHLRSCVGPLIAAQYAADTAHPKRASQKIIRPSRTCECGCGEPIPNDYRSHATVIRGHRRSRSKKALAARGEP